MVPLPEPDGPPSRDSHLPPLVTVADQLHDGSLAVIVRYAVPPAGGRAANRGVTENVHVGGGGSGAAACVTLTVWFAIAIDTLRSPPVFALAVAMTLPLPVPLLVDSVSQP